MTYLILYHQILHGHYRTIDYINYFVLDLTTLSFFAFPFSVRAIGDSSGHATGSIQPSSSSILLRLQINIEACQLNRESKQEASIRGILPPCHRTRCLHRCDSSSWCRWFKFLQPPCHTTETEETYM